MMNVRKRLPSPSGASATIGGWLLFSAFLAGVNWSAVYLCLLLSVSTLLAFMWLRPNPDSKELRTSDATSE